MVDGVYPMKDVRNTKRQKHLIAEGAEYADEGRNKNRCDRQERSGFKVERILLPNNIETLKP
jgi:hypothetical protein